jgi:hypothetical protein
MKAIFVTSKISLEAHGGGVQRCTHEYRRSLQEAGMELTILDFKSDMRWFVRIRRHLNSRPYQDCLEAGLAERLLLEMDRIRPAWLFFNHCDGLPIIGKIEAKARALGTSIAFLSHGLDSTDFLHYNAPDKLPVPASNVGASINRTLGAQLFAERSMMQRVDLALCLAPTDVEIHRWLGAKLVLHLPRIVTTAPLDWKPVAGRVGTIASLMHAPNYHGIVDICRALRSRRSLDLRLRIVGRPEAIGQQLAREYPFVDYLGGLSDAELELEAATWGAFVNPIFTYPRGCSTKLALPLEWQIPIFTSRAGARGYYWDENLVPLADSPLELAQNLDAVGDLQELALLRAKVQEIAAASPTWHSTGAVLRTALLTTSFPRAIATDSQAIS